MKKFLITLASLVVIILIITFALKNKNNEVTTASGSKKNVQKIVVGTGTQFPNVCFIDKDGNANTEPFAEGWLNENGEYDGRPVDVAMMKDGSILVSDDYASAIYRISYSAN